MDPKDEQDQPHLCYLTLTEVYEEGCQISQMEMYITEWNLNFRYAVDHFLDISEGNGTHSSTLAWKIAWMEEPGGLQSMGSLRVGHD